MVWGSLHIVTANVIDCKIVGSFTPVMHLRSTLN